MTVRPRSLLWFAPVGLLVVASAVLGLRYGHDVAGMDEGDVIERFAGVYAQRVAQGSKRDCVARPGAHSGAWLVVLCARPQGTGLAFYVDRQGRLMQEVPIEDGLPKRRGAARPSI